MSESNPQRKLAVLVDGSGIIYRAFYAFSRLTDTNNRPIGAVYGFCYTMFSIINKFHPNVFCVALDAGRKTFRTEIYGAYKGNRPETPPELKEQFPIVLEACQAFGIPSIRLEGYEADDIIATFANKLAQNNHEVCVVSSDKDLMQLITDNIYMYDPGKSKIIKNPEVLEKYGVLPSQMIELQALMGDAVDNVPGVDGVGPKTAANLLNKFQSLEKIYERISEVKPDRIRNNLINQRELLELSKKLVTLHKEVPIEINVQEQVIKFNYENTVDFLMRYGFKSLIKHADLLSNPGNFGTKL